MVLLVVTMMASRTVPYNRDEPSDGCTIVSGLTVDANRVHVVDPPPETGKEMDVTKMDWNSHPSKYHPWRTLLNLGIANNSISPLPTTNVKDKQQS
ncbi:hypothetical protein EVAR_15833_1 [Eumeta japonica]|uniref:Uncharacterized protein n=1 Tax=Eumeta variegata TaxID=151549 RepID=A0A4C1UET9_EUMVA|nr:hypothetical protein EVAR_15833_1 [Eumeta japonica]